jgi:hypothetical protein
VNVHTLFPSGIIVDDSFGTKIIRAFNHKIRFSLFCLFYMTQYMLQLENVLLPNSQDSIELGNEKLFINH